MSRADLYRKLERLGEGGQGRTWTARDTRSGDLVVVKEIHLSDAEGWDSVRRFERECDVLERLDHPGIPKYLDHYVDDRAGRYGLVMELAEGQPLSESQPAMSEPELLQVAHGVLDILEYLHSRRPPVIHRDIKPANLVRDDSGQIRLVDFGGVKEATGASQSGDSAFGTFGYMAPEQYRGKSLPTSDLYGLGATLLALSTGKPPEELPDRPVLGGRVPDVASLMPAGALRETIQALMAPAPSARPQSVARARDWLTHGRGKRAPLAGARTRILVGVAVAGLLALSTLVYRARTAAPPRTPAAAPSTPAGVRRTAPPAPAAEPSPPPDPRRASYRSTSRAQAAAALRADELAGAAGLIEVPPEAATALARDARGRLQLLHLQACEGGAREACRLVDAPGWSCTVSSEGEVRCVNGERQDSPPPISP